VRREARHLGLGGDLRGDLAEQFRLRAVRWPVVPKVAMADAIRAFICTHSSHSRASITVSACLIYAA
jgi:hypothetical protein